MFLTSYCATQECHHLVAQLLGAHRQADSVHEEAAGHPQQARVQDAAQGKDVQTDHIARPQILLISYASGHQNM